MQTFSLINVGTSQDATLITSRPCKLHGIDCMNNGASLVYFKLYDKATVPSNSDTPIRRYMIPTSGGLVRVFDSPLIITAGLGFLLAGGILDNDSSTTTLSTVLVNIDWL